MLLYLFVWHIILTKIKTCFSTVIRLITAEDEKTMYLGDDFSDSDNSES